MREKIQAALQSSRADHIEIRLEERESTHIGYRGRDLESADAVIDAGSVVRALRQGGWGIATFNDRDDLAAKVDQACQCAAAVKSEQPIELADLPACEDRIAVALTATRPSCA